MILCFDITKEQSFQNIYKWFDEVKKFTGEDILIVIIGTKLDIVRQQMKLRQVELSQAKGLELNDERIVDVIETSSKEDTNVDTTFITLATKLVQKYEKSRPVHTTQESLRLDSIHSKQVSGSNTCSC